MDQLEKSLSRFSALSREMRLQMLLNYSKKFPELPAELETARDQGMNRVEECQTPLFLWTGLDQGKVSIHAWAPPEAPTVRGFVGFLIEQLNGSDPADVADLPMDTLERMGLSEVLGVMRTNGLSHVLIRIRTEAARLRDQA
jgi:cysteine desulfuration protein SufE